MQRFVWLKRVHVPSCTYLLLWLSACATTGSSTTVSDDSVAACGQDTVACDGLCTDLTQDARHCGACGTRCDTGQVCSLGICSDDCAGGLVPCDSSCVDVSESALHCGGCGRACTAGTRCENGRCGSSDDDPDDTDDDSDDADEEGDDSSEDDPTPSEPDDSTPTPVPGGGYIRSGEWAGYAWTAADGMASIRPASFASVTDFPLCASGTLQPGYANAARVGWNLNQAAGVDPPIQTVDPVLKGIYVAVSNPGGTELRLQIQGPHGGPDNRWCTVIPGTGGFIPYDAFNTECWAGGNGVAYAGEPLAAALVLVSGKQATAVNFDFCVDALREADNDGPAPGTGCALSGPGTGSFQISGHDTASVTRDGRNYRIQNNVWNGSPTEQALSVEGVAFRVTKQTQERDPRSGAPVSYPSVFIGENFGRATTNSNLPKQVSALSRVPTAFRWAAAPGVYNAAYDVWFSKTSSGDPGTPSGGYLMVWFYDPPDAQPLGTPVGAAEVANKSFQVWIGTQSGVPAISYVPSDETISEWSFDLNDFIRNATDQFMVVEDSWYLTNVFAGFEIWKQGVGLDAQDFCAIVE
jgi:hypothetical protein